MAITIAYDRAIQGWTSEYTFVPDSGLSLNNNFFTFHNGRIWKHNSQISDRNRFYEDEGSSPTMVKFIFNDNPSDVKNFKTLNFEGTGEWDVELDLDDESGSIDKANFKNKQGKFYAYIRGDENQFGNLDLKSTNVKGAGKFLSPLVSNGSGTFMLANVPNSLSVGDVIYRSTVSGTSGGSPELVGRVSNIDLLTKTITVGTTNIGTDSFGNPRTFFTPTEDDLVLYIKNNKVEKSGLQGFFVIVTMTNTSSDSVELFSVSSEFFNRS